MTVSRRATIRQQRRNKKLKILSIALLLVISLISVIISINVWSYFDWGENGKIIIKSIQIIYVVTLSMFISLSVFAKLIPIAYILKTFLKILFNVWIVCLFIIFTKTEEIDKNAIIITFGVLYVYLEVLIETQEKLVNFFIDEAEDNPNGFLYRNQSMFTLFISPVLSITLVAAIHIIMPFCITDLLETIS